MSVRQGEAKVLQPLLFIGTSIMRGEDLVAKGRILIFDILKPQMITSSKLDLLFEKEQRGPVSAITQCNGHVAIAIGPKVFIYHFEDRSDLVGVAFYDSQILTVSMASIKNFFIIGDLLKSVAFLRWKQNVQAIDLLAKDFDPLQVMAVEFLVNGSDLSLIVCDSEQNLHQYHYKPGDPTAFMGKKLICVGNFHLGAPVNKFIRLQLNTIKSKQDGSKSGCCYVTLQGSLGLLAPIDAELFRKLGRLEMRLVSSVRPAAGLNPKAYRVTRPQARMSHNHQRNTLDFDLLMKFLSLDRPKQDELALTVEMTVNAIIDALLVLHLESAFF